MREPTEELGHCRESFSLPTTTHTSFRSPIGGGGACRLRYVATVGRGAMSGSSPASYAAIWAEAEDTPCAVQLDRVERVGGVVRAREHESIGVRRVVAGASSPFGSEVTRCQLAFHPLPRSTEASR